MSDGSIDLNFIKGYVSGLYEGCMDKKMKEGLERLMELLDCLAEVKP